MLNFSLTIPFAEKVSRHTLLRAVLLFIFGIGLCIPLTLGHDHAHGWPFCLSPPGSVEPEGQFSGAGVLNTPEFTVRFANPSYNCWTQEYCLDVEFQSSLSGYELFGMNVRFFYDVEILQMINFRDFTGGYDQVNTPSVLNSPPGIGFSLFGFGVPDTGQAAFVNGAIQLVNPGAPPVYISTSGWTRLFSICFTVDSVYQEEMDFCPPVVWDLEQDPSLGGFLTGDDGVVITAVDPLNEFLTVPVIEYVEQFNWMYTGDGTPPYGQPIAEQCISIFCGPVMTCPADTIVPCGGLYTIEALGLATAFDFCAGEPVISFSDSLFQGTCDTPSKIIRTWSASDSCNHISTCLQEITLDQKGTVFGYVTDDLDHFLAGVPIILWRDLDGNGEPDTTDIPLDTFWSESGTGAFQFDQVTPHCTYVLQEIQPAGYGEESDYDHTPDPDGDDMGQGPDNNIPLIISPCELDSMNVFTDVVCPQLLPQLPPDTICPGDVVLFQTDSMNLGQIAIQWDFGSGASPGSAQGYGPFLVTYNGTPDNQSPGTEVIMTISKPGCPDIEGPVSNVVVNARPDATINTNTTPICYYTTKTFVPLQSPLPGASYVWNFGAGAVPATANGYGPHDVIYTSVGFKSVKLVIYPNAPGAQCPDSSTISFMIQNCPAQITGLVRSVTNDPISGVNLRLYADADTNGLADNATAIRSVFTSSTGSYSMASVTPGNYVIIQTQPSGWLTVDDYDHSDDGDIVGNIDSLDNTIPLTLWSLELDSLNVFVESPSPGQITGSVFDDFDNDMNPDMGEGLEGVTMELFADANADGTADTGVPVAIQITNSEGQYTFSSVPVGHYVVVEVQPSQYVSVLDTDLSNDGDMVVNTNMNNDTIPLTLANGETDAHNYFIDAVACGLLVTNTNDSGVGSLRQAIDCAADGDTVRFSSSLSGLIITINSDVITVQSDVVVICEMTPRVMISSQVNGLFEIPSAKTVQFRDCNIMSGLSPGETGAAFENFGTLLLHNTNVYRNPNFASGQYLICNKPGSQLILGGNCFLDMN